MHLRQQNARQREAPKPKLQYPMKPQVPMFKSRQTLWNLMIGYSLEFGAWFLEF
jgi:hypothetical protein